MKEHYFIPYRAETRIPGGKSLFFAPHPDDEIFGCGGAIFNGVKLNNEIKVVIITDGAYAVDEDQKNTKYSQIRRNESIEAAKILGYGAPEFLEYEDRNITLNENLITHFLDIIQDFRPLNIYAPADTEIHPDHRVTCAAVVEAVKRYDEEVNIMFFELGQPQVPNFLLDITEDYILKNQAMDCFASQLQAQDYKYHINSLNGYRTYTLGPGVKAAEAYFKINSKELKEGNFFINFNLAHQKDPARSTGKQKNNLISIIVRTMGRPELKDALQSISQQTFKEVEVILVDARGTGKLDPGERCGSFPIIKVNKNRHLSRPEASNAGLEAISGKYFCFLDEDDLITPKHLEILFNTMGANIANVVYSNIRMVNEKNELVQTYNKDYSFLRLLFGNYIPIHALLFRSEILLSGCKFDDKLEYYEDWDFLLQVGSLGSFIHIDKLTGTYRNFNTSGIQDDNSKILKYKSLVDRKWASHLVKTDYKSLITSLAESEIAISAFKTKNDLINIRNVLTDKQRENYRLKTQIKKYQEKIEQRSKVIDEKSVELSQLKLDLKEEKDTAGSEPITHKHNPRKPYSLKLFSTLFRSSGKK